MILSAIIGCSTQEEEVPRLAVVAVRGADAATRPAVTFQRLSTSGYVDFYASSISPDGRYVSMIDWSTVDLAVRDLQTGEVHRLTNTAGLKNGVYQDAGVSVFSPDGRIVYGWQVAPDLQLRILDFETDDTGTPVAAQPEVMFHNSEFYPYYPFDWSPDGSQIVVKAYTAGNTNALMLFSTTDGTYRSLKTFDWREPERAAFSPDGRYIAYDFQPDTDSPNRDLFVVSTDGTYESRIVDGPAFERLLGWHPDGSILFSSNRGGTEGIWRIPMSNGRVAGEPGLLRGDMPGVEPLGFAGDRFYYGIEADPPQLYTVGVDFENARLTGSPTAIEQSARLKGNSAGTSVLGYRARGWDWSPDGRYLAYSAESLSGSVIVIRSEAGDEVRSIPLDLERTRRLQWEPDGESLIAFTLDLRGRRGFFRIDLASGSYEPIVYNNALTPPMGRTGIFTLSPDGRTVYFGAESATDEDALQLVAYDLQSGASTPVPVSVDPKSWLAVSPDGGRLAVVFDNPATGGETLGIVPVSGGVVTALFDAPGSPSEGHGITVLRGLEWTPDGRAVVFLTSTTNEDFFDDVLLWIAPVEGGEPRSVKLADQALPPVLSIHPDGRRITFMAGESRGEVWVMDGLEHSANAPEVQR